MFFIEKVARWRRRDFFLIHWVPTLIIFFAFMGVTVWNWQASVDRAREDRRELLSQNTLDVQNNINNQLNNYQEILRGGASLFKSSQAVTRQEWKDFTQLFELKTRHPAIDAISYVQVVPANQLLIHEASVRRTGLPDYKIFPAGSRPIYTTFLYSEPESLDASKKKIIGFDPYTDPDRKIAIDAAAASGQPAFTNKVYSPTDTHKTTPLFSMYYPIVADGQSLGSIEKVSGFSVVVLRIDSFFNSVLQDQDLANTGFRIYSNGTDFYKTSNFESIKDTKNSEAQNTKLDLGNVTWNIESVSSGNAGTPEIQKRPNNILLAGTLISIFMAFVVYILLVSRTRSLALKEEDEIQTAKDELLALASHQLRTPATGVKQFIGMLQEGYAGKLTTSQLELLDKAYDSNERQLTTINEMLSVARADAGRLPIDKKKVNLNDIIQNVVEEQRTIIQDRKQRVTLTLPSQPISANVDPEYFRMAIENIVNNAIKYTPEKGAIDIRLKRNRGAINISVSDTGVGIPERHYSLLFKKFSRIPNELSSQISGTGIGLYLSKYIVEAHGGQLNFSSEPGVGSTFEIILRERKKRGAQ